MKTRGLKPKAKSKAKAKKEQPRCFAAQCPNQKAGKSRFCLHHRPMYQSIEYQAVKARTLPQVQRVFLGAEQAAEAFKKWEKENPPGQGRKSLIDWGAWEKSFGVRTGVSNQAGEEEMDIRDYIGYQKGRGYSDPEARVLWQGLLDDPRSEITGEGAETTRMVSMKRKRVRATEHFEEGSFKEGSKQKSITEEERKGFSTSQLHRLLPSVTLHSYARRCRVAFSMPPRPANLLTMQLTSPPPALALPALQRTRAGTRRWSSFGSNWICHAMPCGLPRRALRTWIPMLAPPTSRIC